MQQTKLQRHAKRQCNMTIVPQNNEEGCSPRLQYSPRDAKASKFSLRQNNIYSSPVIYKHSSGRYLDEFYIGDSTHKASATSFNHAPVYNSPETRCKSLDIHNLSRRSRVNFSTPLAESKRTILNEDSKQRHKKSDVFVPSTRRTRSVKHEIPTKRISAPTIKKLSFGKQEYPLSKHQKSQQITRKNTENLETTRINNLTNARSPLELKTQAPEISDSEKRIQQLLTSISSLLNSSEEEDIAGVSGSAASSNCNGTDFEERYCELTSRSENFIPAERDMTKCYQDTKTRNGLSHPKPILKQTQPCETDLSTDASSTEQNEEVALIMDFLPSYSSLPLQPTLSRYSNFLHKDNCDQSLHYDVTSEDEEDLLNSLSQSNTSKPSSLATSLRLVRVYRNLKGKNQEDREKLILMSRYFQRWKYIVKHLSRSKNDKQIKLQSATSFHKISMVSQHFYGWRFYMLKKQFQAQELYRLHLLSKGMSDLLQARNQGCNMLFKDGGRSFIFKENFIAFMCFCIWKLEQENRQVEKMAVKFWSVKLKQKVISQWKLFSVISNQQEKQKTRAKDHFQHLVMGRFLLTWKECTQSLIMAKSHSNRKVLAGRLHQWRNFAKDQKANRRKQFAAALQLHKVCLYKQCLVIWRRQLKLKASIAKSECKILRKMFTSWHNSWIIAQAKEKVALRCWNKQNLRRRFATWQLYCHSKKKKREEAVKHIQRCQMSPAFLGWKCFVQKKKLNKFKLETYIKDLNQDICFNAFMTWRAEFNEKLLKIHWYEKWRDACVIQAARQWKRFVARRRFLRNHDIIIKQNCFNKWRQEMYQYQEQCHKASKYSTKLWRQKLCCMLRCWQSVCQESKIIQPIVCRMERKTCGRVFDAWRLYITKQHAMQAATTDLHTWKMKQYFVTWKKQLQFEHMFERQETEKMVFKMRKSFLVWKWRTASMKRLKENEQNSTNVVAVCFDRWRENVYNQKKMNLDVLSWFRMVHNLETERQHFKKWKWSLIHKRYALDMLTSKRKLLLTKIFCEWRNITWRNLQLQTDKFTDKLHIAPYIACSPSTITTDSPTGGSPLEKMTCFHDSGVELIKDSSSELSSQLAPTHLHDLSGFSRDMNLSPRDTDSCETRLSESFPSSSTCSAMSGSHDPHRDSDTQEDDSTAGTMTLNELDRDFVTETGFDVTKGFVMLSSRTVVERTQSFDESDSLELSDDRLADQEVASFMRLDESEGLCIAPSLLDDLCFSPHVTGGDFIRPKQLIDVISSDENHMTAIAKFAIVRMQKPDQSRAFYQWKLFVRTNRWKKAVKRQAEALHTATQLRKSFTMKQRGLEWRNRGLLRKAFDGWRLMYKDVRDFEDALCALENQPIDQDRLNKQVKFLRNKRNEDTKQKCLETWRSRNLQLTSCDQHFQRKLLQKVMFRWRSYTEERSGRTMRIITINQMLLKYRFLTCWRRKLHEKKMAEFIFIDITRKRVGCMIQEWHELTQVRQIRREAGDEFASRCSEFRIRSYFVTWKRRSKLRRSTKHFNEISTMRKHFTNWRKFASEQRNRHKIADAVLKKRQHMTISVSFTAWKNAHTRRHYLQHSANTSPQTS